MKKFMMLLFIIASATAFSQDFAETGQEELKLMFRQSDFGDRFAVLAENDDQYNYFVTDLTKFSTRIEKVFFLNLIYQDHTIISLDSDISKDQLWFKAVADLPDHEVSCMFDDLKEEAIRKTAAMSEQEKAVWLEKNDKFNK